MRSARKSMSKGSWTPPVLGLASLTSAGCGARSTPIFAADTISMRSFRRSSEPNDQATCAFSTCSHGPVRSAISICATRRSVGTNPSMPVMRIF